MAAFFLLGLGIGRKKGKGINPQKAFEVRLRLFFENLLWILCYSLGTKALTLKHGG